MERALVAAERSEAALVNRKPNGLRGSRAGNGILRRRESPRDPTRRPPAQRLDAGNLTCCHAEVERAMLHALPRSTRIAHQPPVTLMRRAYFAADCRFGGAAGPVLLPVAPRGVMLSCERG
jgi:hypothetical protein